MTQLQVIKMFQKHGNISANGAKRFFCGPQIGYGVSREVYELKQDPNYVVKLQKGDGFDNVKEWLIWCEISYCDSLKEWFAPCLVINAVGTVLIQKRVSFHKKKKEYPRRIPSFFTDLKFQNFGFIKEQLVCCDYGSVILSKTMNVKDTRFAKWWSHE